MDKTELLAHLQAYSEQHAKDAAYAGNRGLIHLELTSKGKSEAFATAAKWLEESEI